MILSFFFKTALRLFGTRTFLSFLAAGLLLTAGCASTSSALRRDDPVPKRPVILIPGTTCTRLYDSETGRTVWGRLGSYFGHNGSDDLALPIDHEDISQNRDSVVADEAIQDIPLIPPLLKWRLYTTFYRVMERHDYQRGDMDHPKPGDNFFVFHNDWRLPFDANARILAHKIEKLAKFYSDPDLKLDVIAHSSGAMIARYYALYGGQKLSENHHPEENFAGARHINRLILLNPSHKGLASVFKLLHEGFRPAPLPFVRKFTASDMFTMPAFFSLLPRYDQPLFVAPGGKQLNVDLYDPETWTRYRISAFSPLEQDRLAWYMKRKYGTQWKEEMEKQNELLRAHLVRMLRHARDFQEAIHENRHPLPARIKTYIFVTEWGPTLARACLDPKTGKLSFSKQDCGIPLTARGDRLVTLDSMRGQYAPPGPEYIYLRERHRRLAINRQIHAQIMRILSE